MVLNFFVERTEWVAHHWAIFCRVWLINKALQSRNNKAKCVSLPYIILLFVMFWVLIYHSILAIFYAGILGAYGLKKWKIFRFNVQLSQTFLHQFWKFLCPSNHLAANFMNFPKLPQHFEFGWLSLGQKTKKIRNKEIHHFKPTLKFNLFRR